MKKSTTQLLTVPEAAGRLGVTVSTIRRRILERRIASVKIGKSVRIPIEAIDQLITAGWRDPIDAA